jgi:hypothetical protein
MNHSPVPEKKDYKIVEVVDPVLDLLQHIEVVANNEGWNYALVIPVFLSVGERIFMWNRSKPGYDEISMEKFLIEVNPVAK